MYAGNFDVPPDDFEFDCVRLGVSRLRSVSEAVSELPPVSVDSCLPPVGVCGVELPSSSSSERSPSLIGREAVSSPLDTLRIAAYNAGVVPDALLVDLDIYMEELDVALLQEFCRGPCEKRRLVTGTFVIFVAAAPETKKVCAIAIRRSLLSERFKF